MKSLKYCALAALPVLMIACTSEPAKPATDAAPPAAAPAAKPADTGGKPRVFFIEPMDGATVKSPVHMKFGSENFMIMAVPDGEVHDVRPGMGHFHVAADTECLAPGTAIQKAAPWTHFGKGTDFYDLQLPPGKHKLTLQAGDDKHTTIEGLCQTIEVTVQ